LCDDPFFAHWFYDIIDEIDENDIELVERQRLDQEVKESIIEGNRRDDMKALEIERPRSIITA